MARDYTAEGGLGPIIAYLCPVCMSGFHVHCGLAYTEDMPCHVVDGRMTLCCDECRWDMLKANPTNGIHRMAPLNGRSARKLWPYAYWAPYNYVWREWYR